MGRRHRNRIFFGMSLLVCISLGLSTSCKTPLSDLQSSLNSESGADSTETDDDGSFIMAPGTVFQLPVYGGGTVDVTAIDSTGDGMADGLDIGGSTTVDLGFLPTDIASLITGLDGTGNGQLDFYLHQNSAGQFNLVNDKGQIILLVLDNNGNVKSYTTEGTVIVTTDEDDQAPDLVIDAPALGESVAGTVPIQVSAEDNAGLDRIEFYINGNFLGQDAQAPFSIQWDTTAYPAGSQTVVVVAWDGAGNPTTVEREVFVANESVAVDSTPPVADLVSPFHNSYARGSVVLEAVVSDEVAVDRVEFFVNNASVKVDSVPPFKFTWNSNLLADGAYPIKIHAFDAAGNMTVDDDTTLNTHNTPPTASVTTNPAPDGMGKVGGSVAIEASVSTALPGDVRVDFYQNGEQVGTDLSAPYAFTWNALLESPGSEHTWSIQVYDALGNQSTDEITVEVDNTGLGSAPVAAAGDDQLVSFGAGVNLNGSASADPDGYLVQYTWTEVDGLVGPLNGYNPSFTAPSTVQTLRFDLVVQDNYGNNSAPDRINVVIVKNTSDAIFVDGTAGAGDGSQATPYNDLSTAVAAGAGKDIYIMSSVSYNESGATMVVADDTELYGGYNSSWERDPVGNKTVIQGASTVFQLSGLNGSVTFSGLSITSTASANAAVSVFGLRVNSGSGNLIVDYVQLTNGNVGAGSDNAPGSNYGLYAVGLASVQISNSNIQAGAAGSGATGATGATGDDGDDGVNGVGGNSGSGGGGEGGAGGAGGIGTGGGAANGSQGGNGGRGGYDSDQSSCPGDGTGDGTTGYGGPGTANPCGGGQGGNTSPACYSDGQTGGVGSTGSAGSLGSPGATPGPGYGAIGSNLFVPVNGNTGGTGTGGTGGTGAGGGGGYYGICDDDRGGGGGGGGGGGAGGDGGLGGRGAGGSFAVFVVNVTNVNVADSTLTAGTGGAGGVGGTGGGGGPGGSGGPGGNGPDDAGPGGTGGTGGAGGPGGYGSGGNGGPSIGLLYSGGAVSFSGTNTVSNGSAGSGGISVGNNGNDGQEAMIFNWSTKTPETP